MISLRVSCSALAGSILWLTALQTAAGAAATEGRIFTVPPGAAGFYRITSAAVTVPPSQAAPVELRVDVRREKQPVAGPAAPIFRTTLAPGTHCEFDPFLGYLEEGDGVACELGSGDGKPDALPEVRWEVERSPSIPVARFDKTASTLDLKIPHSGFYALDGASVESAGAARVTVSCGTRTLRETGLTGGKARFNLELGYLRRGEILRLASSAPPTFRGTLVEWAPRRAPLRVQRGPDGLLDVLEPRAPLTPVDIPADRWVRVAALPGDGTAAIRKALREAGALAANGGFAGVRLDAGATYLVASGQTGGAVFPLDGLNRVVLDGNGAIFDVRAVDLDRRGVELFLANDVHSVVLADFRTRSEAWNSTFGTILEVSPPQGGNQTVTFRLDDGQESPLVLIPSGYTPGYAYDAKVPGRLVAGTWSHYPPPSGSRVNLEPTADPRIFRHTVTRTNQSIPRGESAGQPGKWLVKQKKAGVLLLTVRSTADDITLCGVVSGGATNGVLRLWGGSGVNVLGCRIEPPPGRWISTSSDGFHGRAREAVWLEDVKIAGVCEDVLNLYATPMGVAAVDAGDASVTLLDLSRNDAAPGGFRTSSPVQGAIRPGDWLVFSDPASGMVRGRVRVRTVAERGRCELSAPVAGLQPWDAARGRSNTVVYNESVAAGMVMRDCEIRDSLRFGAFLKARDCLAFHNTFTGLTGSAIHAANEPEWPEGPFAQNLWLQDNTFAGNAHGYESRHRAFLAADPAAVSVYARKLGGAAGPGVLAASNIRIVGNTFAGWRGVAVAVRNARSVQLLGNQFRRPLEDEVVRETLARDPLRAKEGQGRYAAILLESCSGVHLKGNRGEKILTGDLIEAIGAAVTGLEQEP